MHAGARQFGPGKCPTCGMAMVPEGTRFPFLRHMVSSPRHLMAMLGLMLLMAAVMMMLMA
jgi:heavy metal-binding protein